MTVMKYLSDVIWHILAEVTVKKWLVRLTERSEVLSIPVMQRGQYIIRKYHDELDACAKLLIEKEKITREEFEALFEGVEISED